MKFARKQPLVKFEVELTTRPTQTYTDNMDIIDSDLICLSQTKLTKSAESS